METRIRVRLTPRSARDEIAGWQDGVLRVRVSAPPAEGKANAALERILAAALRVPKTSVRVAGGKQSRDKVVTVDGIDRAEAMRRLRP